MEYTAEDPPEAKRSIDSSTQKRKEPLFAPKVKENAEKRKSQIILARRRVAAFEISRHLIE